MEHKKIFLLNKIINCSLCGDKYTAHVTNKNNYYRCLGYKKGKCRGTFLKAELIEQKVKEAFIMVSRDYSRPFEYLLSPSKRVKENLVLGLEKLTNHLKQFITSEEQTFINEVKYVMDNFSASLNFYEKIQIPVLNKFIERIKNYNSIEEFLDSLTEEELYEFYLGQLSITYNGRSKNGVVTFLNSGFQIKLRLKNNT